MPPFSIECDDEARLLHIVMRGYWDQATFDSFARAFEQALTDMHASGGLALALVDGRAFVVQGKDIGEQFRDLIDRNQPRLAKRTASVVAAQLNKLQAARSGRNIAAQYFMDMDEARAWLFSTDEQAKS